MNDLSPVYAAVGGILKDQRAALDAIIAEQAKRVDGALAAVSVTRRELVESDEVLRAQIESVERTAERLRVEIADLPEPKTYDDEVHRLNECTSDLQAQLRQLRLDSTGAATAVHKRIADISDELQKSIDALPQPRDFSEDIERLGLKIVELKRDLRASAEDEAEAAAVALEAAKSELRVKIAEIESRASSLTDSLIAVEESSSEFAEDVSRKIAELMSLGAELREFADDKLAQTADRLESKLIELERYARTLEVKVAEVQKQRGETGPRGEKGEPGKDAPPPREPIDVSAKTWEPGIHREGTVVQYALGKLVRAVADTNAPPSDRYAWERIGTCGWEFKGVKSEHEQYEQGDVYIDGGSLFCWWDGKGRMLVQRGRKGDPGERGEKGAKGDPGRDAPQPLEMRALQDAIAIAYDDGAVLELGAKDLYKLTDSRTREIFSEMLQDLEKDGPLIRRFRGQFNASEAYAKGDVVVGKGATWLAREHSPANSGFGSETWMKIAGAGGRESPAVLSPPRANPVGTVIAHVSQSPPPGYLPCDGGKIPDDTRYTALRALIGANTPDLRGQFGGGSGALAFHVAY